MGIDIATIQADVTYTPTVTNQEIKTFTADASGPATLTVSAVAGITLVSDCSEPETLDSDSS